MARHARNAHHRYEQDAEAGAEDRKNGVADDLLGDDRRHHVQAQHLDLAEAMR